jgi:hypothetical protein
MYKSTSVIKNCQHCGKEFISKPSAKRKFCSYKCNIDYKNANSKLIKIICGICGKVFYQYPHYHSKYCSYKCSGKSKKVINSDKIIKKNCLICGKEFECYKSHNIEFCSRKCFYKHFTVLDRSNWKKSSGRKANPDNYSFIQCLQCHKIFKFLKSWPHKFCSCECNYKFVKEQGLMKGKNHPNFGKIASHPQQIEYDNKMFRSSWEANFAKWLDLSGIKWEYESKAFELKINNKDTTYTPDFYLPEFDCYIEIKGRWYYNSKEKFDLFLEIFSDINIKLLQKKELKLLGVI